MTSLRLSEASYETLKGYRDDNGHNSIDSAFREILIKAGIDVHDYYDPSADEDDEPSSIEEMVEDASKDNEGSDDSGDGGSIEKWASDLSG